MIENEDGGVTGSIDVSKLNELNPKTDEAKAQIDALKAENQAGREQAEADAQRLNEGQVAANPLTDEVPKDQRDAQGKATSDQSNEKSAAQKSAASKSSDKG